MILCPSVSPLVAPPHCPDHACSPVPGSRPLCSCCPSPTPSPHSPPILYLRAITVTFSANEGWLHGGQAPMRLLFHLYKTFGGSLLGCTFCQSGGSESRATAQRERGKREHKCEHWGGGASFNPNITLQESGG